MRGEFDLGTTTHTSVHVIARTTYIIVINAWPEGGALTTGLIGRSQLRTAFQLPAPQSTSRSRCRCCDYGF